jgi:hypothetical protein
MVLLNKSTENKTAISARDGNRRVFLEKIQTSGSIRNHVAGGLPIHPSIRDNIA